MGKRIVAGWILALFMAFQAYFYWLEQLACILFLAPLNSHFWGVQAFFIALTFFPLALIAEIIWKQYFEVTLFFVTYVVSLLLGRNPKGNLALSKR
jgi:hypothetical protein